MGSVLGLFRAEVQSQGGGTHQVTDIHPAMQHRRSDLYTVLIRACVGLVSPAPRRDQEPGSDSPGLGKLGTRPLSAAQTAASRTDQRSPRQAACKGLRVRGVWSDLELPLTSQTPRMLLAACGSEATRHTISVAADLDNTFDATANDSARCSARRVRRRSDGANAAITQQLDEPLTSSVVLDARRIAWARGTSTKTILVAGEPARMIVAVAGYVGADLLVIRKTASVGPARCVAPEGATHCPIWASGLAGR